jgi:hypothetical protein
MDKEKIIVESFNSYNNNISDETFNIFAEEYQKICEGREYIVLPDVLKINNLDENNEVRINFAHIRK